MSVLEGITLSRSGFVNAAVQEARQHDAILVDLETLGQGLDG
jgi:hypothetical protein